MDIGKLKKLELLFPLPGKAIPLKVFGRWGAGKITFFQKGVLPRKSILQQLICQGWLSYSLAAFSIAAPRVRTPVPLA